MSFVGKFNEIKGWASHGKDEKLVEFKYDSAPLQSNDIEIEISHCGICGSDLHTLDSGWGPTDYPVIVGHEIIGKVTAKGSDVTNLEIGDRVEVGAQAGCCMKSDCYACSCKREAHCPDSSLTYNSKRKIDGFKTYGGYAEAVRVQKDLAFKIPESIPSEYAAPLLCAGATVFTPMLQHEFKEGDKIGVVGIGGLGHLALQFAAAKGCEVYAFSYSHSKEADALKMGAKHFIAYSNPEESAKVSNTLKYLIITSNFSNSQWSEFSKWMKLDGKIILLSVPEEPLKIEPMDILSKNLSITGSIIGSICEIEQMLEFAGKHEIFPWIEKYPMSKANEGVQHVRDGNVRYRVVLENYLSHIIYILIKLILILNIIKQF